MAINPHTGREPVLLQPPFVAAGAALLVAGLVTDSIYYSNSLWQWANFSAWLITGGLLLAMLAGVFFLLDVALDRSGALLIANDVGNVCAAC